MHHKQGEAYTHRNYLYCRLTIRCKTKLLPRQSTILEYSKLIAPLHRCFSADVRCSFKQKSSLHTQRLCITTIAHDVPYRQIKVDCCRVPWYRCISTTEQHHARGSTGHACPLLIVCYDPQQLPIANPSMPAPNKQCLPLCATCKCISKACAQCLSLSQLTLRLMCSWC